MIPVKHPPFNLSYFLGKQFIEQRTLEAFLREVAALYSSHKTWSGFNPSVTGFSWRRMEVKDFLESKGITTNLLRWFIRWYKIKTYWKRAFGHDLYDTMFISTLEELL